MGEKLQQINPERYEETGMKGLMKTVRKVLDEHE